MESKVIGIDFDGTIVEDNYPEIGKVKKGAMLTLKQLANRGHKIVIWTCRDYGVIADFFTAQKIKGLLPINLYINENPSELRNRFGNDPRKIGADIFIDDKNIFCKDIDWNDIREELTKLGYL